MQCPVCKNVNLTMTERQGIEIDYCPECRGIWLDRGELDKIIERSSQTVQTPYIDQDRRNINTMRDHHHDREHDERKYDEHGYKKKKHGLLGDLFDF